MKKIPRFIPPLTSHELIAVLGRKNDNQASEKFSRRFLAYIGAGGAVIASSARVALSAILEALAFPTGSQVILPSLTFNSIPRVFLNHGLQPRFVDIDPTTFCLDANQLDEALSENTVAIMPVHLYGRACDMVRIQQFARRHNLTVIEDVAQGCGGTFAGKRLGSFGRAAIFSFGPAKNLSSLGCGMAVTDTQELAEKIATTMARYPKITPMRRTGRWLSSMAMNLATHPLIWRLIMSPALRFFVAGGWDPIEALTNESPRDDHTLESDAYLMPDSVHTVLAMGQLEKLDEANLKRIRNGNLLLELLAGIPGIDLPAPAPAGENIFHSFVAKVDDRQNFRRRLLAAGVDSAIGNMHVGPDLPGLAGSGEAPHARDAVSRMVHLPVYPQLTEDDIRQVAAAVRRALVSSTTAEQKR